MNNIFEYPLNEKTRIYLKLEYIFSQIMDTKNINIAWNYKVFFIELFELIEILEQINKDLPNWVINVAKNYDEKYKYLSSNWDIICKKLNTYAKN